MLYRINDGTVSAGGQTILSHIDFEVKDRERIGIVGANGTGKTTLLRLIAGELSLARDDKRKKKGIETSGRLNIAYLKQTSEEMDDLTVSEFILENAGEYEEFSKERFLFETEYDRIFTGLGFEKEDKNRKIRTFSGGQKTKIALIDILLKNPDILLLDEPTNHLDIETTEWVEKYLQSYSSAIIIVSHDRFFLDQTVHIIYELRNGTLTKYSGDYSSYRKQKQKQAENYRKTYEMQQKEIERLDGLINKFKHKPRKAAFARSRKTILDRMEKLDPPGEEDSHMFPGEIVPEVFPGKWVLDARDLSIGYEKALLKFSLKVKRGQKIAILGENGVGKTTFLKTAAGYLPPISGECILGERTTLGYFDQLTGELSSTDSVLSHFQKLFPGFTDKEARQTLSSYLFRSRTVMTRVCDLSGGEKSRLVLAELLSARPNLLILDEPTNHMDIAAKETLESAFHAYTGTILFVSHDRYFVDEIADSLLIFEKDKVFYYPFGYKHYLSHRKYQESDDMAAMLRAEDKAMIESFRNVPEKERHRLREISTEEAYLDWQFRLQRENMESARQNYLYILEKRRQQIEKIPETLEEWMSAEKTAVSAEEEQALESWTEECIRYVNIIEGDEYGKYQ